MPQPIVTRFAPSPTGYLHVGNLRTLLYSYLFARQNKGKMIFRIEDTDQERYVPDAEENLKKTVVWAGIKFDEGIGVGGPCEPYHQSKRTEIYRTHVEKLLEKGNAYRCFCSKERLEEQRQKQEASKLPTRYDGHCRDLTTEELSNNLSDQVPFVIRLKVPSNELVIFDDIVRGKVKFASKEIDDQVLLKSDGFPTYHLANVVDDHLMSVTHVIRGEEWLSSTPKHLLLYQAFDWSPPTFAHLPLLLNADRSKLSKRQGDVAVEDYIAKGYSRDAILNFIAFLGWNPGGTKEIFSLEELITEFDIHKVQKAGAIFNLEKLNWFNWVWKQRKLKDFAESQHLDTTVEETKSGFKISVNNDKDRMIFAKEILSQIRSHLNEKEERDEFFLLRTIYANKDKILQEPTKVEDYIACYFIEQNYDPKLLTNEKMNVDIPIAKLSLSNTLSIFESLSDWSEPSIKNTLMSLIEKLQLKNGQVLWPVRVALTGMEFSPGAFESAWVLGKEKALSRISNAINKLET